MQAKSIYKERGPFIARGPKSVSRETDRVKQGQGPRSLRPGPFFGPRGGWVLTYAPGRADRWPRTRQPGTRATDHGSRITDHGSRTRQQLRDQLGRQPPAPGTRTTDQAALGSHQAARTWQRITAAAALTWQQITARAAVSGQQITANQAARPTVQAAQTRQQLRTIRAPGFTRRAARATGQAQAASSAVG